MLWTFHASNKYLLSLQTIMGYKRLLPNLLKRIKTFIQPQRELIFPPSFMAITTVCASTPASPPTISPSSIKTHQQQQLLQHLASLTPSSPCKFHSVLIANDAVSTIAAAAEALALARAAAEAAREAVALASAGVGEGYCWSDWEERSGSGCGLGKRRKKRRKRRRGKEIHELSEREDSNNVGEEKVSIGSVKSGFLSSREEAELCMCIKV